MPTTKLTVAAAVGLGFRNVLLCTESISLNITKSEFNIKGRVMKISEPVVGERELIALDLDGVRRQSVKMRHPKNVEFSAVVNLDTEHGYSLKDAGKN